jgi:hypothetical protein
MTANSGFFQVRSAGSRGLRSPGVALYASFGVAVACALLLALLPRAIAPTELPALTLPAAEVAQVLRDDARRAAAAPQSDVAHDLARLFVEFGRNEVAAFEDRQLAGQRRRLLHHAFERVVAADGEQAVQALRESVLAQFESALDLQLPAAQVKGVVGVFPNLLEEHKATYDGEELAPHFVMRTLYKARWNLMNGLAVDWHFARIERVAYFGWMGLHAENLPIAARRQALQKYAALAGPHADEAVGVLAFLDKDYAHAVEALTRAHSLEPCLRLRNYLNGARVAAALAGQQPQALAGLGPALAATGDDTSQ